MLICRAATTWKYIAVSCIRISWSPDCEIYKIYVSELRHYIEDLRSSARYSQDKIVATYFPSHDNYACHVRVINDDAFSRK